MKSRNTSFSNVLLLVLHYHRSRKAPRFALQHGVLRDVRQVLWHRPPSLGPLCAPRGRADAVLCVWGGTLRCSPGSCYSYPAGKMEGRLFWALSGEGLAFCLEIASANLILKLSVSPISFSQNTMVTCAPPLSHSWCISRSFCIRVRLESLVYALQISLPIYHFSLQKEWMMI